MILNAALLCSSGDRRAHKSTADLFARERPGNEITFGVGGRVYRSFNFNGKISSGLSIYNQTCKMLSCALHNGSVNIGTGNKVVRMS